MDNTFICEICGKCIWKENNTRKVRNIANRNSTIKSYFFKSALSCPHF